MMLHSQTILTFQNHRLETYHYHRLNFINFVI